MRIRVGTEVSKSATERDGYELLEIALDGEIESEWFPEYRSHFVKTILTVEPKGAEFWGVFVWNETTSGWEPLPIGADLFSVKDGHVMAWALVEYNPRPAPASNQHPLGSGGCWSDTTNAAADPHPMACACLQRCAAARPDRSIPPDGRCV